MSSQFGRKVVGYKTNQSGGGVIAGDVVIPDTSNDNAFTTTTSAALTTGAWVADETIASGATGRVVLSGHVTLINVTASVTRGHTGTTSTTVKKAVSTGGTTRSAGTFCKFTTGGTTPEADIWPVDLGGGSGELVSTSAIWTAKGQVAAATGSGAASALTVGANDKVLTSASGQTTGLIWNYPPGYQFDYATVTSQVSVTHTTEGTADTIITGGTVAYDGSTEVLIEAYIPAISTNSSSGANAIVLLYEDSTLLGRIGIVTSPAGGITRAPLYSQVKRTPSNASHQYLVKATTSTGTATVGGGAGGSVDYVAATLRVTKS